MTELQLPDNIQSLRTANFADYGTIKGLVCCGWMDFHSDYDIGGANNEDQNFSIEVFWVNDEDEPVFVHTSNNKNWEFVTLEKGKLYTFNAVNLHGLIPKLYELDVAETTPENIQDSSVFARMAILADVPTSPKLIFKFIG